MALSDAVSTEAISPRARASSCSAPDHRREHAAPAVGRLHRHRRHARRRARSAPPGIVNSNVYARVHPTISPASKAHCVRSSSARTRCRSARALRGGAPNPRRSISSIAGSSASVIGRTSSGIRPFYSGGPAGHAGLSGGHGGCVRPLLRRGAGPGAGPRRHTTARRTGAPARRGRSRPGRRPGRSRRAARRAPTRAGSGSRTERTPGRAPRRRRRAAGGCRTRAGRSPTPPRSPSAATTSAARPYARAAKTSGTLGITSAPARIHSSRVLRAAGAARARADPGADRAHHEHEPVDPGRLPPGLQHERGEEREEARPCRGAGPSRCRPSGCSGCAAPRARSTVSGAAVVVGAWDAERREHPDEEDERRRCAAPTARARAAGSAPRAVRPRCRRGC